jgi:DNA uptake protein ComE-like DNA-binding protein
VELRYKSIAVSCIGTLMVASALGATEAPSKTSTPQPATTQAPAQPAATKPSTAAQPPAAQPPAGHPSTSAMPSASPSPGDMGRGPRPTPKKPTKPEKMVDLNNASLEELKTLPSVGDDEAKKIIANRPYTSRTDLVSKAGLPDGIYLAVRHRVVINDMKKPSKKTESKKPAAKPSESQK